MKTFKVIICLIFAVALSACKKSMNADEISEKASSGVVLIMNYFYYSVTLPNGEVLYFTDIRDGELMGLTDSEEEAYDNCSGAYGTGFFISDNGLIMTNRHVARPDVSEKDVKEFLRDLKKSLKQRYGRIMDEAFEKYSQYQGVPQMQQKYADIYRSYERARENIDNMDMNDAKIRTYTNIYVVYNGSHVTNSEDLHPCTIAAVSKNEDVDLALIQLKGENAPEDAYIFQFKEDDDELSMNEPLYMIGFNRGLSIAKTSEGDIKSQTYTGNITQKGDGNKILYSIPSQHGSSGSPVVNKYGEVVAVNFAGWDDTQGFNYGIPLKKVRQFLKDN